MKIKFTRFVFALSFFNLPAFAFKEKAISVGIGYYSQNAISKVAVKDSGEKGFFGEIFYPFNFQYDYKLGGSWFVAPRLSYTLFSRSSAGSTAKVTFAHLAFPFGQNFKASSGSLIWDWWIGPGLMQYKMVGAGGTTQMNNGTGTATFAIPGDTVSIQKITTNLGVSVAQKNSRLGFDLMFENAFSSSKRTQSIMLSYAYQFGGR